MNIGIPKEIKTREGRVALTPVGVRTLVHHRHKVSVEKSAGAGSGIQDAAYEQAGACLVDSADKLWAASDMIVKVKEPIEEEYVRMREGQILFTYLHLAANERLTKNCLPARSPASPMRPSRWKTGACRCLPP
jgi:alanine dehydrogenase